MINNSNTQVNNFNIFEVLMKNNNHYRTHTILNIMRYLKNLHINRTWLSNIRINNDNRYLNLLKIKKYL
jgi:hypothetical protein